MYSHAPKVPIIILTGLDDETFAIRALQTGAQDYLVKERIDGRLLVRSMRYAVERKRAQERLEESYERMHKTLHQTVEAIAFLCETRDRYTAGHQRRVTRLACDIGQLLGLSADQIEGLKVAGLVHDIGKISVPAEILNKPGKLTDHEYSIIKTHPRVGYDMLRKIDFPWPVADTVLEHHERLNGSGYPSGLSGESIVPHARILAVADVVEAMASHRPYRPAHPLEAALDEIKRNRASLYDPHAVDACSDLIASSGFTFEESPDPRIPNDTTPFPTSARAARP